MCDRVILWTRVPREMQVQWEIAADQNFERVLFSGIKTAHAERDFTIHADPAPLEPATVYCYRFHADGETSPIGRTKTLPANNATHLRFAQVSCAKFNAGFFNSYVRIAERDDLDFLLHLGDYIYEAANNPPAGQTPGADIGRAFNPLHVRNRLTDGGITQQDLGEVVFKGKQQAIWVFSVK